VRNKAAEICEKYLTKGDKVYLEGRIKTRKWQDDSGNDRYSTEIQVNDFTFLRSLLLLFATINVKIAFGFALLIILLICSALISGAEVALFSLSRTDLEDEALKEKRPVKIITKLLEHPKKLLATRLLLLPF